MRWRAGRRRTLAAAIVSVAGGALLALPLASAKAETVQVDLNYNCTGGVAGPSGVNLKVTLTLQTALTAGQPLDIKWGVAYRDGTRFLSPGLFQPGARVSATGVVDINGPWAGKLDSLGSKDQALLQNGGALALPDLISGAVATTAEGEIEIVPRRLLLDFTPPASEAVVNDDDPAVTYGPNWTDYNDRDGNIGDVHVDVHASQVMGAEAAFKFTGTGVDFISEQSNQAGQVQFLVDGQPGIPATADASKEHDGSPVLVANKGNYTLWGMRGLPYKEHTLTVKKLDTRWAMVDGFKAVTEQLVDPPKQFRAECKPVKKPTAIRVNVGGTASPSISPSDSISGSPSVTPSGSVTPTGTPTPTGTGSHSPSPSTSNTQSQLTTVVVLGTPTPTATTTVTLTATPTVAQVKVTPKGGAQTGEAPVANASGRLLVGSGSVMLLVGVLSGVALLRRRAAHAGDRSETV
ncbi:hypothetical protein [Planotetraspora sp. GP83]|uniref:hypothetical protein n=1 Tax=Planotetraspora sp. GP83 TaxID=3156264 RepID=UPI00351757B5